MKLVEVLYVAAALLGPLVATKRGRRALKGVMRAIARVLLGRKQPPKAEATEVAADKPVSVKYDPDGSYVIRVRPTPPAVAQQQRSVVCMACKCAWCVPMSIPLPAPCPNCEYYSGVDSFLEVEPLSLEESVVRAAHWREVGPPPNPTSWYNPN